jgi:N-methylhydantoinase B
VSDSRAAVRRIRDFGDEEFISAYDCDRFSASVLLNRLRYTVEHMSAGFLRQSFSPIIRDWYDFACTVSGPPDLGYPMAVVSASLTGFVGSMADAVANAVEEFGAANLSEGDVLICNDPYRSGTHVNDLCFIRPVFWEGRIVSFVNLRAHQLDIGGVVPGGFSATKTNVYENGLVIPPMLLWQRDQTVRSTFSLVCDNTRFGGLLVPDFWGVYQQLRLGERLIHENIEKYGLDALLGTLRYACDSSAERMYDAIEAIPDGDYFGSAVIDADAVDDAREYVVCVTLRKRGHEIEADLSGTSAQARTSINGTIFEAKTAVGASLTMLLDPTIPFTSGTWRRIDLVVPPGSVLSAMPPEGPTMMYWEPMAALQTAIFTALNPVLGDMGIGGDFGSSNVHNGHGFRVDGTPWSNIAQVGGEHGPWGASRVGDADSYTVPYKDNNLDPAVEQIEHDSPCVVLRKEHSVDTAGAGFHRGGAAHRKDTLFLTAGRHYSSPFRFKEASGVGAHGARPGATGGVWIFPETDGEPRPSKLVDTDPGAFRHSVPVAGVLNPESKALDPSGGRYHYYASRQVWETGPGSIFRYQTNAGGGWGDPFTRDPARVLRDVRDEYVSIAGAARDYGVVVLGDPQHDPEGLVVDEAATVALRDAAARREHGSRP